jgi:hypothetical protein
MSYNKTDGIPQDHPLAQLLARSQRANKLPSCEGCNHGSCFKYVSEAPEFSAYDCLANVARFDNGNGATIYRDATHFCAAWEPKQ